MDKKALVVIFGMFCLCSSVSAQKKEDSNVKFLKRYEKLIDRVQDQYAQVPDSVDAWKLERTKIRTLYKERYKESFTDDELEKYAELSAVYKSKMTDINLMNVGERVDSVGSKVSRSVRKTGKKVSGFIKGLKKQSDKNRKND